uniref:Uncharacterized protein n=1 Tax=Haptolina ericina TaxID=156174 RepID=A0A7S3B943_9EUKA
MMHILQHVLLICRDGTDKHAFAQKLARQLQQGHLLSLKETKGKRRSAGFADAAPTVHEFLKEFNSQGAAPPAAGKKLPIISRLAGGIHAWKGDRVNPASAVSVDASCEGGEGGEAGSQGGGSTRKGSRKGPPQARKPAVHTTAAPAATAATAASERKDRRRRNGERSAPEAPSLVSYIMEAMQSVTKRR